MHKIITKETKKKIAKTKSETGRQQILEGAKDFTKKPSKNNLKIPSHRKHKFISLDEYKNRLANGETTLEICKTTSKHIVYFYNALLKGRITLSKEDFENMYNGGMSLDEIAKQSKIPREYITQLRDFYGIKRKGATFQKRINNEQPLSQEAKDIIIGSMLGDGHITPLGYFSEKHSEKQVEYLEWKASFLIPILTDKSFSAYKYFDKRHNSTNYSFSLRTIAHSFLYEMREKFYKTINGKHIKIVPDDIGDIMNETVLAVWFMDDGSTDWMYRHGEKEYANIMPQCKISSQSFSLDENIMLAKILLDKFDIVANIKFREKVDKHPFIKFDSVSSNKLTNILKHLSVNCCLYKFSEAEYIHHKEQIYNKEKIFNMFCEKHNIFQKR
jgi:hypothetical protein